MPHTGNRDMRPGQAHPFEISGLGVAPFRCVGMTARRTPTGQPAGTCQHCGTGILYCYHIVDAAGKKTIVGSQCVFKTLSEFDRTLTAEVRKLKAKADREAREAKNLARWAALAPRVDAARNILATRPTLFANLPHPNEYFASQGRTLRDYYEYCLNGGEAGRVLVCRAVESAVKGAPTSATKFVPSAKATEHLNVKHPGWNRDGGAV